MEYVILLILGIFVSGIGIVNLCGNISTIHSYNRRNVKEEDVPKYGKLVGLGTLVMGHAVLFSFFIAVFWGEAYLSCVILPGFAVGLVLILYAQFKYNKGIF